jgi:hypothetical protein
LVAFARTEIRIPATENRVQNSGVYQGFLARIQACVNDNDVKSVLKVAEALYSINGAACIQQLQALLDHIGKNNRSSEALRSRLAAFAKVEIRVPARQAIQANLFAEFAQRLFDAIVFDNSEELTEIIEGMIDQLGLPSSLNVMNNIIENLARERMSRLRSYDELKSCFTMLNGQSNKAIPPSVHSMARQASGTKAATPAVATKDQTVVMQAQPVLQVQAGPVYQQRGAPALPPRNSYVSSTPSRQSAKVLQAPETAMSARVQAARLPGNTDGCREQELLSDSEWDTEPLDPESDIHDSADILFHRPQSMFITPSASQEQHVRDRETFQAMALGNVLASRRISLEEDGNDDVFSD